MKHFGDRKAWWIWGLDVVPVKPDGTPDWGYRDLYDLHLHKPVDETGGGLAEYIEDEHKEGFYYPDRDVSEPHLELFIQLVSEYVNDEGRYYLQSDGSWKPDSWTPKPMPKYALKQFERNKEKAMYMRGVDHPPEGD
jgi:hypothetical protein